MLELPRLVAVGGYIVYRHSPLASVAAITDAAARYPRGAGAATLRAAVRLVDGGSESPPESMLREIAVTAGIPGLVANEWIRTSSGHNYRGDLVVRSRRVVIQVNADDLDDPGELLARISRVLASRPLAD